MFDPWPRIVFTYHTNCFKSRVRNVLACVKTWTGPERGREWKQEESRSLRWMPKDAENERPSSVRPPLFSHQSRRRRPLPDPTIDDRDTSRTWSSFKSKEKDEDKSTKLRLRRSSSEPERRGVGKLANFPISSDSINFLIVSFLSFKANCLH